MKTNVALIGIAVCLLVCSFLAIVDSRELTRSQPRQREVAITFDDLPGVHTRGSGCDPKGLEALNRKLINSLTSHDIPALGLVVESRLCDNKKEALSGLLKLWLDAGLELGNHSYSHFDLNNTPLDKYQADVIRGELTTRKLLQETGLKLKYFRHPYLHAGKDIDTKRRFEKFLVERGYQVAPVTIDNQEWVFAEVYARAVRARDQATAQRVASAYVQYMEDIFEFFERRSIDVVGYEIKQVLLLHVNPLNADYFDKLVEMIKKRGYTFKTVDHVLKDPAYGLPDNYAGPVGLSWLHRWAITKGIENKAEPREPQWIKRLFEER